MRIHQDDTTVNDPLVVLLDQRQQEQQEEAKHYNPLRMLELLVKGFCPTILTDRDEIHVVMLQQSLEPHYNNVPNVACPSPSEHVAPGPPGQITTSKLEPSSITKSSTNTTISGSGSGKASRMVDKHYFEIGERPPSNLLEISKKLWDNFCRGPYNNNHPGHQHPHHALSKGFCAIVNDYLCHNHNSTTMNSNEHEVAPDGEECSVYSEATVDVDLSPQSSPCLPLQLPDIDTLENERLEEEEEEEEEIPIAEFLHPDQRHIWRLQVLVTTCLALYMTLWLLATTTTDNSSFHFALTRKQGHTVKNTGQKSLSFLSIHSKQGDVCSTSQNLVQVPAIVSKEEETAGMTTNGTF